MASRAFAAAVAAAQSSKNLDTILVGSDYLAEGSHAVTIKSVDISKAEDQNIVKFTYVSGDGRIHNDNIFLLSREGNDFGYGLRALWSGCFPDTGALAAFLDAVAADDAAFEMMTGMKLKITLEPGKGFQVRSTGLGGYAAYDVESGDKISETDFATAAEAKDDAEARGFKRSYLRARRYEATNAADNIQSLYTAIENGKRAKDAASNFSASGFSTGYSVAKAV